MFGLVLKRILKRAHRHAMTPQGEGLKVWTNGVSDRAMTSTLAAVQRFKDVVPRRTNTVTRMELEDMFNRTIISWTLPVQPLREVGCSTDMRFRGHEWLVSVPWRGSIAESELNHSLLHLVNEAVRLPKVAPESRERFRYHDQNHLEADFWAIEGELVDTF